MSVPMKYASMSLTYISWGKWLVDHILRFPKGLAISIYPFNFTTGFHLIDHLGFAIFLKFFLSTSLRKSAMWRAGYTPVGHTRLQFRALSHRC